MTIYELTQAIARYKRAIFIGLGVIFIAVVVMMFTYEDGGITWRGGLKYESSFEISVVAPGTDNISNPDPTGDLSGTADEYAQLLGTAEAAEVVGDLSGYRLDEPISADSEIGSSIITGSVIGPTPDDSKAASQNAFVWLAQKIQQPLDAQPVVPTTLPPAIDVSLEGPFPSTISVEVDDSLADLPDDLFVLVDAGNSQVVAVPVVQTAGGSVEAAVTVESGGSLLLELETADGTLFNTLRLAPGSLPTTAAAYPSLVVNLGPESLVETTIPADEEEEVESSTVWTFDASEISAEWVEGVPIVVPDEEIAGTRQVQVAMLTEVPTALQIGGRRAPLMGFTVLVVGLILLLTGVIIADTWRRSRDEASVSKRGVANSVGSRTDSSEAASSFADEVIGDRNATSDTPESATSDQ